MPVYSHTQLSVFEECPQRYRFQYIDKLRKPEEQGIEAFVGSRVHETLEKLYEELKYGKMNSLEELGTYYRSQWQSNWGPAVRIVREGLSEANYQEYGARCIRNYYGRHYPFDESQTLKTEFHLVFSLDPEARYRVQGYIDRLARRSDGVYEIHDYKTGISLPTQAHADSDRQLALYQIGLKSLWKDVDHVDLVWHYVGVDSMLVSQRSSKQLDDLSQETIALIGRIENCHDFYPVRSNLCDWCEYRSECPAWKHVLAVSEMPPQAAAADDGVRLANEYAAAKRDLELLSAKVHTIKARIVEYAQKQQVTMIEGTGVRVSVTSREQVTLPNRQSESWRQIEALLKASGKWAEVAELSVSRLTRALRECYWPLALIGEIEQLLCHTFSKTVRLCRGGAPPWAGDTREPDTEDY